MVEAQRYTRLQHLLEKSSIYSKFLLQRMESQLKAEQGKESSRRAKDEDTGEGQEKPQPKERSVRERRARPKQPCDGVVQAQGGDISLEASGSPSAQLGDNSPGPAKKTRGGGTRGDGGNTKVKRKATAADSGDYKLSDYMDKQVSVMDQLNCAQQAEVVSLGVVFLLQGNLKVRQLEGPVKVATNPCTGVVTAMDEAAKGRVKCSKEQESELPYASPLHCSLQPISLPFLSHSTPPFPPHSPLHPIPIPFYPPFLPLLYPSLPSHSPLYPSLPTTTSPFPPHSTPPLPLPLHLPLPPPLHPTPPPLHPSPPPLYPSLPTPHSTPPLYVQGSAKENAYHLASPSWLQGG